MTGLLKGSAVGAAVRPLQAREVPLSPAASITADPTRLLQGRIEELEGLLAKAAEELPDQLDQAREAGRQDGLKERDEATADRLQLLERGMSDALASLSDRLSNCQTLAIEIGRAVLERMIGNPDWRSELMRAALTQRFNDLDARSILAIRVSGDDFTDAELGPILADPKVRVSIDPELRSGECMIDLTMGHIEVGPDAQWRRIAALLDECAAEPC